MTGNVVVSVVIVLCLLVLVMIQFRRSQSQLSDLQTKRRSVNDEELWLSMAAPAEAEVVRREVVISPKARQIAKVDLELSIRPAAGEPTVRSACWLVEVDALPQLEVGCKVSVKFHPRRPARIFPAVPWARAWLFGKPRA